MNLFTFQKSSGGGFSISQQFWLFIVLAVPLTILTIGSWYWFSYKRRPKKKELQVPVIDAMDEEAAIQTTEIAGLFRRTFSRPTARNRRHTT
jgi:hypothetical protein